MYTSEPLGPATRRGSRDSIPIGRDQPAVITRAQPGSVDLIETLQQAWQAICAAYDVKADLPETPCLFDGIDLRLPKQAAEAIVANMLLSVMEEVGRFSSAYKQPIGLTHIREDAATRHLPRRTRPESSWRLAPETREHWQHVLHPLALALEQNRGLLLAAHVLGEFTKSGPCGESRVMACCLCVPPRVILINRIVLSNANIVCETCQQPFHVIAPPDDD